MWRLLASILLLGFWCQPALAATFYQVNTGATVTITEHSECAVVTNSHASDLALFVPTGSAAEWTAFRASPGTGVTALTCDTTPAAFNFTDVTGQALNTIIYSNTLTISGINTTTPVSVSGTGTPQISINGGGWVTSGNITNGQTVRVRLTSANAFASARTATANIGGVTNVWSVTTRAANNCTVASGTTWVVSGKTCTAPSALNVNHGSTGSRTDSTHPTTGTKTFSCNDGTLGTSGTPTCVQSCAANTAVAWSSCDALSGTLLANGANRAVANTTSGYTGTRVITCNNGTLAQSGGSCTAVPPSSCGTLVQSRQCDPPLTGFTSENGISSVAACRTHCQSINNVDCCRWVQSTNRCYAYTAGQTTGSSGSTNWAASCN